MRAFAFWRRRGHDSEGSVHFRMLYMVVERFKNPGGVEVYERARERGRMLPEGLEYVASWTTLDFTTCYQLMETANASLMDVWLTHWNDLVDFEVVPVRTSAEAMNVIKPQLGRSSDS